MLIIHSENPYKLQL